LSTVLSLLQETIDEYNNNNSLQLKNQHVFILPALPTPRIFSLLSLI